MSIALSVNLNKIALVRNSREGEYPSVENFGRQSLETGAQGLTVHPRPDQRHIRVSDLPVIKRLVDAFSAAEFNIEGNPFADARDTYPGLMTLVEAHRPHQCTLVPDANHQLTSDHGFDLRQSGDALLPIIEQLHSWGVRVSLFMDPDPQQIQLASELGADRIELYTGPFAKRFEENPERSTELFRTYVEAAESAHALGLGVNAGHDLNLDNMALFRQLPHLSEVSIGHALTVDALKIGFTRAVQAYLALCRTDGQ